MGEHLLNFWRWLLNAAQQAAIAENPAVMTAAGWRINRNGLVKLDLQNNKNIKQLRNNLTVIGNAAITAPTMTGDIDALATAVRHPVLTIKAVKKGISNVSDYVRNINKIRKELYKGIKENSILESYNTIPANKDIGTAYDYLDFLDNIYPDSKLNATFYHGGPKGIKKFKSAKELGHTNKRINSGTKDHGIYLADNKSLALYYAGALKKGNRQLYNVRVDVEKPMRYETNDWYSDRFKNTEDLKFNPGAITLKWYDKLNLKNYDGIYHSKSTNPFDDGELVMFNGDNIHIMGTPEESYMFRNWKLNPQYSPKSIYTEIPITPELYDRTFSNYIKAAKPGIFFGGLAATPPFIFPEVNQTIKKRRIKK